jgi:hypothetical protein
MAAYKFYDWNLPPGGEAFGLLRADGSRRPAFDAWAMVIQRMSGVEKAALAQTDLVDVVRLTHMDGRQTLVAWARTGTATQLHIQAEAGGRLLDQYGHELGAQETSGSYTLALDAARCNKKDGCAVGGAVQLLVLPPGDITVRDTTQELTFQ